MDVMMMVGAINLSDFIIWIYLLIFYVLLVVEITVCEEYCFGKDFHAGCNSSEVILMQTARYGRMYSGECITADESSLGCYGNVIDYLDEACSGQVECMYPVQKLDDKVVGCYQNDRLRFLDATYMCIQVPNDTMCIHSEMAFNSSDYGYLKGPWNPSEDSLYHLPGTLTCPWTLSSQPGQQIQISVVDLSLRKALNSLKVDKQSLDPCPIRLRVSDAGDTLERSLCHDSYEREIPLYRSIGSNIEVYVLQDDIDYDNDVFYLFHYQVIGCVDLAPPDNAWIRREGDELTVRCNATGDTWYLVCKDNDWFGYLGNCTLSLTPTTEAPVDSGFPWGIVIAVAIGIAIGVTVGLLMLALVIAVIKWKERRVKKRASQRPDLRNIEVPYNTTAQMQKNPQDNLKDRQGSIYGTNQTAQYPQVNSYPEQTTPSLYQPGPSRLPHQYSTVSDPSNPMYHFYDQQNQESLATSRGIDSQTTLTTEPDEHVYETAYFTRPPTMGKENERESRQKSLAKEYYEMRESPQGTLKSVVNKETQPTKY